MVHPGLAACSLCQWSPVCEQAILALKYIHDLHILHRDLKSGNFFLSKSGAALNESFVFCFCFSREIRQHQDGRLWHRQGVLSSPGPQDSMSAQVLECTAACAQTQIGTPRPRASAFQVKKKNKIEMQYMQYMQYMQ